MSKGKKVHVKPNYHQARLNLAQTIIGSVGLKVHTCSDTELLEIAAKLNTSAPIGQAARDFAEARHRAASSGQSVVVPFTGTGTVEA